MKLNDDGSLNLLVSTTDIGQGSRTVLAQIAADALGVPFEAVRGCLPGYRPYPGDQTDQLQPLDGDDGRRGPGSSRERPPQLLVTASRLLEVDPADLTLEDGAVRVAGAPDRSSAWRRSFAAHARATSSATGPSPRRAG